MDAVETRGYNPLLVAAALQQWHAAALLLFVIALARPQRTNKETVVESDGIDIVLAIDVSGSMEAADFALANHRVSRLEAAKAVVDDFVMAREHDRIGLVVFGEEAFTQVPLTLDHQSLSKGPSASERSSGGSGRSRRS